MPFKPFASLTLALALALTLAAGGVWAADAAHPTVVEEFQSQGCSSCPPANANLNAIAGRPDILALSFAVTYWDQLGWKDTFDSPAYTARQWDYAHAGGRAVVYTPQMVVNGRGVLVGNHAGELEAAIRDNDRGDGGPKIRWQPGKVAVTGRTGGPEATVWLVRYDPREVDVRITAGENRGRTLPHRNIVKDLIRLGAWTGGAAQYALPAAHEAGLRTALLVQEGTGGPILAADRIP